MDPRLARRIDDLQDLIEGAGAVAGFTGAGISTESGIPDFRSPESPWMRHKPIPFEAFLRSDEARREAWRRKFAMDDLSRDAQPNRGHFALAALVRRGKMPAILTQNIDGLHQASGVRPDRVIELHGNGTYATCLSCGERHELGPIRSRFEATGLAPACELCGGIVKSATISFGQSLDAAVLRASMHAATTCDVFLTVGTSLQVHPAAGLCDLAKANGAVLVILNDQPTPYDELADLVVREPIGTALPALVDQVLGDR